MKMEREIHHIDEYFNEGLENIEVNPPEEVWNNITKELDRKRRVRLFTIWTGMAAGLALLVSLGIYFANNTNVKPQLTGNSKATLNTHQNSDHTNAKTVISEPSNNAGSHSKAKINEQDAHASGTNVTEISTPVEIKSISPVIIDTDNNLTAKSAFDENRPLVKDENSASEQLNLINTHKIKLENKIPSSLLAPKQTEPVKIANIDFSEPTLQPTLSDKPKTKHWSMEGQVAPQYSYRNISAVSGNGPNSNVYNKSEDALVAYVGGIKVNYETSKRLSFQTGIFYSVMGQTMNKVYGVKEQSGMSTYAATQKSAYWLNNSLGPVAINGSEQVSTQNQSISSTDAIYSSIYVNKASGNVLTALDASSNQGVLVENAQIIQQLKFIEIPVLARYKIIDRKLGCNLIGGVSTNVLVNSDVLLKQNGSKQNIGETTNLQKINYSGTVGIGLNYRWFKNINLTLEPTYKYYLNSISLNENMKVHLYAFGI